MQETRTSAKIPRNPSKKGNNFLVHNLVSTRYFIQRGCTSLQFGWDKSKKLSWFVNDCKRWNWELKGRWIMAKWSWRTRCEGGRKAFGRAGEVWLTICILFRGHQGTWLNPVRLNPLGEHCCQRPSRKPFTDNLAPPLTGRHLYSCQSWVIEEKSEREQQKDTSGPHPAFPSIVCDPESLCSATIDRLTWAQLICICNWYVSICLWVVKTEIKCLTNSKAQRRSISQQFKAGRLVLPFFFSKPTLVLYSFMEDILVELR